MCVFVCVGRAVMAPLESMLGTTSTGTGKTYALSAYLIWEKLENEIKRTSQLHDEIFRLPVKVIDHNERGSSGLEWIVGRWRRV